MSLHKKLITYFVLFLFVVTSTIPFSVITVNANGLNPGEAKIFDETWESGNINSAIWKTFGTPSPSIENQGYSSSYSITLNGDSNKCSGVVSKDRFKLLNLSGNFYGKYEATGGNLDNDFELALTTQNYTDVSEDGFSSILGIKVSYENSTDNQFISYYINNHAQEYNDTLVNTNWHKYGFEVNSNETVSFYLDDVKKHTTTLTIDTSLDAAIVIVGNNSTNHPHYVDSIHVENLGYPFADFSFSPTNPLTSDTINFYDESIDSDSNIVNWSWDFDDTNTSFIRNTTHQYSIGGIYSVSLTVTDYNGNSDTIIKDVTVTQDTNPPTADFSYELDYTSYTVWEIDFTDMSTDSDGTIVSWSWDFDDGNTITTQNPSHTYSYDGTYTVMLTVTDNDGLDDSTSKTIKVYHQTPKIQSSSPGSTNNVAIDSDLLIDFNVPMDPQSVEDAFSITPSVSGLGWSWDSNNEEATITHNSFSYSQSYTYTISIDAHDDTIFENNLDKGYSYTFSTNSQPGCVKFYIKDFDGTKLNPKVYVGDSLKGTASNGYLEVCLQPGTYTFYFELSDYPRISKSITINSGESQSVDIVMSQVDFSSSSASMGFEFDLSELSVPISGQFSIPISITPIQKFNPGETYKVTIGYTNKRFSISGTLPSVISKFLGVVDESIVSALTKGFALIEGDKITGVVIDSPVGSDKKNIYPKTINVPLLADIEFDLWLNTEGDIKGQIISEGPVSLTSESVYFTQKTFTIKINEDAKSGEEVRIGIIPSYEISFKLTARAYVDFIGFSPKDSGEKQFYPSTGMTSPISISSDATIGFIGAINKPPTANFTFEEYEYTTLSKISLTDLSNDPDGTISKWSWDFGDGQKSNSQSPTFNYNDPGTYMITLTVEDDSGAEDSITKSITIEPAPVKITSQILNDTVSGTITLSGIALTSGNLNGPITKVEIKIDDSGTWKTAEGTSDWTYRLDTNQLENGCHEIQVRCSDGTQTSEILSFGIIVNNQAPNGGTGGILTGENKNLVFILIIIAIIAIGSIITVFLLKKYSSNKKKSKKVKKERHKTEPTSDQNMKTRLPKNKQKPEKRFIAGVEPSKVASAGTAGTQSEIIKQDEKTKKKITEEPTQPIHPKYNFCENCGKPVDDNSNFCIHCGQKLIR